VLGEGQWLVRQQKRFTFDLVTPKIICIGANKTGTTSLNAFFAAHGYRCGDQRQGEMLIKEYAVANWKLIIDFVSTADFFQDLPFSARHTYKHIAEYFPDAKFILTRRRTAAEWYESLIRYHAVKFGDGVDAPDMAQLKAATYRYPGFAWEANRVLYGSPESDPYHRATLMAWYDDHLAEARAFFAGRPEQFLEIEISDAEAAAKIAFFAGFENNSTLPHLNKWPGK
jgi:hypothetical protein